MTDLKEERGVVIGSVLFILFFSINKQEPTAKSARKAITQLTKKRLAIYRTTGNLNYLKLMIAANKLIMYAGNETISRFKLDSNLVAITPSGLLSAIKYIDNSLLESFEYSDRHLNMLSVAYKDVDKMYTSLVYVNYILSKLDEVILECMSIDNKDVLTRISEITKT